MILHNSIFDQAPVPRIWYCVTDPITPRPITEARCRFEPFTPRLWRLPRVHLTIKNLRCDHLPSRELIYFQTILCLFRSPKMVVWQRLIRFVATDGRTLRGEPVLPLPDFDLGTTTAETKLQAKVITGDDLYDTSGATKVTEEVVTVRELLGPLTKSDVPILRCVGLNYAKHSESPVFWFDLVSCSSCSWQFQSRKRAARLLHSPSSSLSPRRASRTTAQM